MCDIPHGFEATENVCDISHDFKLKTWATYCTKWFWSDRKAVWCQLVLNGIPNDFEATKNVCDIPHDFEAAENVCDTLCYRPKWFLSDRKGMWCHVVLNDVPNDFEATENVCDIPVTWFRSNSVQWQHDLQQKRCVMWYGFKWHTTDMVLKELKTCVTYHMILKQLKMCVIYQMMKRRKGQCDVI